MQPQKVQWLYADLKKIILFIFTTDKTIAIACYQEIEIMHQKLILKQHALVNRHGPILFHNNPQLHMSQTIQGKLSELSYEIVLYL